MAGNWDRNCARNCGGAVMKSRAMSDGRSTSATRRRWKRRWRSSIRRWFSTRLHTIRSTWPSANPRRRIWPRVGGAQPGAGVRRRRATGALFDRLRFRRHAWPALSRDRCDASTGRLRRVQTGRGVVRAGVSRPAADHSHVGCFRPGGRTTNRGNFVELMLRLGKGGQPIRVVQDFVARRRTVRCWRAFHRSAGARPGGRFPRRGRLADLLVRFRAAHFHDRESAARPARHDFARVPHRSPASEVLRSSNAKMEAVGVAPMPSIEDAVSRYLGMR